MPSSPASAPVFDVSEFLRSRGCAPSGVGLWAFGVPCAAQPVPGRVLVEDLVLTPRPMPYAEALLWVAQRHPLATAVLTVC